MPEQTGTVTASHLNLRADPSTRQPPSGSLPRGTRVEILGRAGSWYRVRVGGHQGFVHSDFILLDPVVSHGFLWEDEGLRNAPLPPAELIPDRAAKNQLQRATADTWNRYGGLLTALSQAVAVPTPSTVAVLCVESSGHGFIDGRMVIRFENHVFWNQWGRNEGAAFRAHFRFNSTRRWTGHQFRESEAEAWQPSHTGQDSEWQALAIARRLHEAAALRSISMGTAQIMGFNYARSGYDSVREMFDRFSTADRFQILGMFDFIKGPATTSTMLDALRGERYEQFATGYNGTGQSAAYGARIRARVDAFRQIAPTTALGS